MRSLAELQQHLSYCYKDSGLLERAVTHKSYANEHRLAEHNERMEFLGDAVLNLVVSEQLMNLLPTSSEGELSRLRAAVVSEPSLAAVARRVGLGEFLRLGRGEEQTGGRNKDSLLADSLEAIVASIYLDGGIVHAASFIIRFFQDVFEDCKLDKTVDFKTKLQEICQEQLRVLPEYRVVSETGPDHKKKFTVDVSVKGERRGTGSGKSKKEAEQQAAKKALEFFRNMG